MISILGPNTDLTAPEWMRLYVDPDYDPEGLQRFNKLLGEGIVVGAPSAQSLERWRDRVRLYGVHAVLAAVSLWWSNDNPAQKSGKEYAALERAAGGKKSVLEMFVYQPMIQDWLDEGKKAFEVELKFVEEVAVLVSHGHAAGCRGSFRNGEVVGCDCGFKPNGRAVDTVQDSTRQIKETRT